MLRRRREEVLPELPPARYRAIEVPLGRSARALPNELWRAMSEHGADLDGDRLLAAARRHSQELVSRARSALAAAKVPAALEVASRYEDAEEPLVVFSAHRAPVDVIGVQPGWAAITGATSAESRGDAVARFQRGELRGLAATIQCGGVGFTLTRASHVLFVDRAWTPSENRQAEDRLSRIGQRRGVMVLDLVADHPLDRRVTEVLRRKAELIEETIDGAAREDAGSR